MCVRLQGPLCGGRHRDTDRVCTQTKGSFYLYARDAGCAVRARARGLYTKHNPARVFRRHTHTHSFIFI